MDEVRGCRAGSLRPATLPLLFACLAASRRASEVRAQQVGLEQRMSRHDRLVTTLHFGGH